MHVVYITRMVLLVPGNCASGGRRGCMLVVYITRMVLVPGNCASGGRRGCMLVVYITRMVLVPGNCALGGRRGCMPVVYITRMVFVQGNCALVCVLDSAIARGDQPPFRVELPKSPVIIIEPPAADPLIIELLPCILY